jgi:LPS export ABC transporter protein LptC
MRSKFFLVLLTALAVGILVILSSRGNGVKTYPLYKTSSMRGFHLTHKESGKIKWELIAEKATFPEGNKDVVLKNLTMRMHHEREFTVRGGSGIYNIQKKNLTINKPIEIDIEGDKLTTDSLTWNGERGVITTKDSIKFKGKNFLIEGTGLIAKIKDQQIRILKNVKGIFYPVRESSSH